MVNFVEKPGNTYFLGKLTLKRKAYTNSTGNQGQKPHISWSECEVTELRYVFFPVCQTGLFLNL